MSKNKRNELSTILRRLADYIEHRSDEELIPLFEQAANLIPPSDARKKYQGSVKSSKATGYIHGLATQLAELPTRERGDALLREKGLNREALEALGRYLRLPIQRDDTIERLRAKIVEHVIGSRLRSDAIQGEGRLPKR
jgi:hypothetical protein